MKILNTQQIKLVDFNTIVNLNINSVDLMEKAAGKCLQWIEDQEHIDELNTIHIFCGMGNNGGDGLALGRMLNLEFYDAQVYIVHFSDKMSDDFITNYNRAEEFQIHPISIHSEDDFPEIKETDFIIDAIFGTGINKAPSGFTKKLIKHINQSKATIISIDIPSGLFADKSVVDRESIVKSTITLTFQMPKLAFLLPDNGEFVPHFELLDIGLDQEYIKSLETPYHFITRDDVFSFYKKRNKFSHKGSYGHALIIGGSFGKMGSVTLAAKAALKIGSGLVTAYIPKCGYHILQTSASEVMVEVDAENEIEYINFKSEASVIGLGIGIGTSDLTSEAVCEFLKTNKLPIVIDADALNIISKNLEVLDFLSENCILTPHPKELERLIGKWQNDYEKLELLKTFSLNYPFVIVVKGAHTMVIQNGIFYFNSTGSAALAKAGTGDVLTGMITGLLAQHYSPLQAAIMGVFLHGLSADVFTTINSPETFLASDILNFLPGAFNAFLSPYDPKLDDDEDEINEDDPSFLDDDDDDSPF
jgi:hydroxyethylthiazole kinase-like uncharacterized protein yjeF